MRTVWKYPLNPGVTRVQLTSSYLVRSVGVDPATGEPAVWVELEPARTPTTTTFVTYGTGHEHLVPEADHTAVFVGTVWQVPFVWHVYEHRFEPF